MTTPAFRYDKRGYLVPCAVDGPRVQMVEWPPWRYPWDLASAEFAEVKTTVLVANHVYRHVPGERRELRTRWGRRHAARARTHGRRGARRVGKWEIRPLPPQEMATVYLPTGERLTDKVLRDVELVLRWGPMPPGNLWLTTEPMPEQPTLEDRIRSVLPLGYLFHPLTPRPRGYPVAWMCSRELYAPLQRALSEWRVFDGLPIEVRPDVVGWGLRLVDECDVSP